jgi:hypothetical protein
LMTAASAVSLCVMLTTRAIQSHFKSVCTLPSDGKNRKEEELVSVRNRET